MNTSNTDTSRPYMPELPEGFYWEIRKTAPGVMAPGDDKVIVFLRKGNMEFVEDTVAFSIVTKAGKVNSDPTEAELHSAGESMLMKTSTKSALGLIAPLQ